MVSFDNDNDVAMQTYTLPEIARKIKIDVNKLKRACDQGLIKATQMSDNRWCISENELTQLLELRKLFQPAKRQKQKMYEKARTEIELEKRIFERLYADHQL